MFTNNKGSTKLAAEEGKRQQKLPPNIFVRYIFSRPSQGPYDDLPMDGYELAYLCFHGTLVELESELTALECVARTVELGGGTVAFCAAEVLQITSSLEYDAACKNKRSVTQS